VPVILARLTPYIREGELLAESQIELMLRSDMEHQEDTDQFKALEESVGSLISKVSSLKEDKELLMTKVREQDKIIADMKGELDNLRKTRDNAKLRIQSILDKIGKMDI
jgi:chromosome segregation ATPase